MKITHSTTLQTLAEQYGADYLLPGGQHFSAENRTMTLQQLHEKNPTWSVTDMEKGLQRLETELKPTYLSLGKTAVPNLIELRAQKQSTDAFVILLAGGAYGAVCTLCESLPAAAELNALGVDCYCLNYRTATPESFVSGLMPKPLDDLAAAVRFIKRRITMWQASLPADTWRPCGEPLRWARQNMACRCPRACCWAIR